MNFFSTFKMGAFWATLLFSIVLSPLAAQEDPFYFPPNESIPDTIEGGLIIYGTRKYPHGGFRSVTPEPQYANKNLVWQNAPYIIEGVTLDTTRSQNGFYYPGLIVSDTEYYYIIPYFVYHQYKGEEILPDTILILQARPDYNYVNPPAAHNHDCNIPTIGNSGYNSQSFIFLQPKVINGKKYYMSCNYYYDGFAYIPDLDKYFDDRCPTVRYSKAELLDLVEPYTGNLTQITTPTRQSIEDREKEKREKEEAVLRERRKAKENRKSSSHGNDNKKLRGEDLKKKIRELSQSNNIVSIRGLTTANDGFVYSIGNQQCVLDSGKYVYSFSIYASAQQAARYFVQGTLFLRYNKKAFGEYIDFNNKVTVTKGFHFTDPKYSLIAGDDSADVFLVSMYNNGWKTSTGKLMSFQDIHLFTIEIELDEMGTNENAGLVATDPSYTLFYSRYQTAPDSIGLFDTIIIKDIAPYVLCPHPFITTKFKPLGAFHAGTNETIEIRGKGFGDTEGMVHFTDANTGPGNYTNPIETRYILGGWSDTLIEVEIPSLVRKNYGDGFYGCAGSGPIKITTKNGDAISKDSIYIEYAHTNKNVTSNPNSSDVPLWLARLYCINGFYFTCDTSLQSRHDMVIAIDHCLKQWADSTGLQLGLEKDALGNVIFLPRTIGTGRNFIYIDPSLPTNKIMSTPIVSIKASSTNDLFVRFNTSTIAINPIFSYYYNPSGDKPAGYIDFVHTFLHEIGHILCMDHRICYEDSLRDLLYFGGNIDFTSSANRAKLSQWASQDMDAVKYIIGQSKLLTLDEYQYVTPLTSNNLTLSPTPTISPAHDTILCVDRTPYTYTLTSSASNGNFWSTLDTSQSIIPQAPSILGGNTERTIYYTVRRYDDECTVASLPSLPVKILWKRQCLRPPEEHLVASETKDIHAEFEYYPNPARNVINMRVNSSVRQSSQIHILDVSGRQVLSTRQSLEEGHNRFSIDIDKLASGFYILQLNVGNDLYSNSFTKSE